MIIQLNCNFSFYFCEFIQQSVKGFHSNILTISYGHGQFSYKNKNSCYFVVLLFRLSRTDFTSLTAAAGVAPGVPAAAFTAWTCVSTAPAMLAIVFNYSTHRPC